MFCFYGEPGFIEMRTEDWGRFADAQVRTRTFLLDGTELFNVRPFVGQATDLDMPRDLPAIIEASRILSKAIRRPFVRLDFFESEQGLMFGEVTQHPGRLPLLVPEWDERFGQALRARLRAHAVRRHRRGRADAGLWRPGLTHS
ncbi:ATP-grasp fold amidoligase family protein [Aeromicrobium sp. UC242_57]|uniref:ATP-grasp fold amidoligase family protein n=1 Tax=Aeromicrobium sp. UC242_57 TaxID=3374624 RepID=UPI00379630F8